MTGFKYGLLAIESTPTDEQPFQLADDAWTFERPIDSLFGGNGIEHRRDWMGIVEWDRLTRANRVVVVRHASARLNVINHENQAIQNRLEQIRLALLLTRPNGLAWGRTWFFDGPAEGPTWDSRLVGIQTSGRGERMFRPFYCTQEEWIELRPWPQETPWLERWRQALALLSHASNGGYPSLLFFALMAFERAFESYAIEFRIPDCVRAAEAILGLPRNGGGAREFARRVSALVPELAQDSYVGGPSLSDRLVDLYGHRNDCVHGKVPFERLKGAGPSGEGEAARFEYLAEAVARAVLVRALQHPSMRQVLADRRVLEDAWSAGAFP